MLNYVGAQFKVKTVGEISLKVAKKKMHDAAAADDDDDDDGMWQVIVVIPYSRVG